MKCSFKKYQGTGNDFILIDNRGNFFNKKDTTLINKLCDRRFGIGADGLILLESDKNAAFSMVYFNADGNQGTMCGNGGRCIVAFAASLDLVTDAIIFNAIDGLHEAIIRNNIVSLKMIDVPNIALHDEYTFLHTGSPHHIKEVTGLANFPVKSEGKKIRNSALYGVDGSNVNFVEQIDSACFAVRTYERGVEDETLSCGTGVTAVAIAMHAKKRTKSNRITLQTLGGNLEVSFTCTDETYHDIWLTGSATEVFTGHIIL